MYILALPYRLIFFFELAQRKNEQIKVENNKNFGQQITLDASIFILKPLIIFEAIFLEVMEYENQTSNVNYKRLYLAKIINHF